MELSSIAVPTEMSEGLVHGIQTERHCAASAGELSHISHGRRWPTKRNYNILNMIIKGEGCGILTGRRGVLWRGYNTKLSASYGDGE